MRKTARPRSATKIWQEDPAELAKRRREAGLSQAEVAKRTGRSRSLIRDLELGKIKLRGKLAHDVWTVVINATPPRRSRNAFADQVFGRLPWASEKPHEVTISMTE